MREEVEERKSKVGGLRGEVEERREEVRCCSRGALTGEFNLSTPRSSKTESTTSSSQAFPQIPGTPPFPNLTTLHIPLRSPPHTSLHATQHTILHTNIHVTVCIPHTILHTSTVRPDARAPVAVLWRVPGMGDRHPHYVVHSVISALIFSLFNSKVL